MFAEVYKKDSLQEEEYAECYVFDKRMLLPKADSEPYSSDYDENIIKNFHQKQSSYAQSEGYHSYVSSNDSAIIAPFSDSPSIADDRPQADSDFIVSADENVFSAPKHSNSITDFVNWPAETSKCRNSYSHSGSMKNVNYDRYNSQHIAHSARVQTPQKLHSETVLYLDAAKAPQQQFHKDANHNHSYANSQLRKLYPVHTYSIQPQTAVASSVTSGVSEFNGAKQSQPPLPPPPSKLQASKHFFEIDSQQFDNNEHCAEYTFLDPSKKRIVSNQNLKVIQKQALISYYERHHSAWRSEPQLSFNSSLAQSQSRPRLPTPTSSCHLTSASDDEELTSTDDCTNSTNCNAENFTRDNVSAATECKADDYSCRTSPLEPILNDLAISAEDRVPELPPKKACFRATAVTHRMPSPDLPPPSPPPLSDEELYISDEPLPPPPPLCEAAFVCDSPNTAALAVVSKISTANCDISTNATIPSFSSRSTFGTRTNTCGVLGVNELLSRSLVNVDRNVVRCDATAYNKTTRILSSKNPPSTADYIGKTIDSCNSSRLSSSSFRTYTRTANEFNAITDRYIKRQSSSPSAGLFCEKQQDSYRPKLPRTKDTVTTSQTARGSETHQIEPKVKTIRTLFEDKFRKSINSKHFQFPSFSFMHSDKFPSKLDPRFPRTSYQITQCSNYREIRDSEEGIVSNATAIYKRTTSPTRQAQGLRRVNSFRKMINDAKYDNPYESTAVLSTNQTTDITTFSCSSEYVSKANNDSAVNENTPSADAFAASVFGDRVAKIPVTERSIVKYETTLPAQCSPSSSPFSVIRARSVSNSSLNSTNIPESQSVQVSLGFSEDDALKFSNEPHSAHTVLSSYVLPASSEFPSGKNSIFADTTRNDGRCSLVTNSVYCQKKVNSSHCEITNTSSRTNGSKNCTIDAASQTDINVIAKEHILDLPTSDIMSPRIDVEVEKLRREVINCLGPTNRLYKILAHESDVKKSTDYLENIFQATVAPKAPAFLKNSASVNEPEDTRLQEGSISYHETELEILQRNPRSEVCDKSQNVSPPMVCLLQKKKKNLIKHLILKLNTLKAEQNAVSKECHQNDELGMAISEKILRCLSSREASKYKLHIQEIGQITNLLLSLGARLAKIENSLTNLSENCQNEKKILEDKKQQLVLQLEDAKELKKNIDKRSFSLTSLLQKYFNEQELNEYQQFIQTKCQLLICNRNLSDEVFQIEQQVNALKENDMD